MTTNLLPTLRGLNFWTLKQKIKDHTIQRTPTIQLLQKIDIYKFAESSELNWFRMLSFMPTPNVNIRFKSNEQKDINFLKTNAELKRSTGEMKSHSFVLQFLQIQEALFAKPLINTTPSDTVTIKDSTNTGRSCYSTIIAPTGATNYNEVNAVAYSNPCTPITGFTCLEAPSGNVYYGILIGTGVTAPTNVDYSMETPIAHGNGGGQLQWQATSVGAAAVVGANVDLVIVRPFVNSSGGSITLREIGLAIPANSVTTYTLLAHDAVNQAVANTEVALASYVIRTTV